MKQSGSSVKMRNAADFSHCDPYSAAAVGIYLFLLNVLRPDLDLG